MKDSKKEDSTQNRQWEHGWDEHNTMQLRRLARLSLEEKLEWLEEAHRLVRQMEAARSSSGQ
jgi:hypothetical protein